MTSFAPALLLIASLQAAPARVEVLPATAEVTVDAAVTLSARVLDADGELLTDAAPRWLSLNPELFTVDQGGRVTGIRPGKGQIAAVIGGTIAGFADVTVPQLGASSLDVTPLAPIVAGTSAPLRVTATTRLGERLDEPDLTYESGSPEVAGVDVLGRVYGRSPGTAAITVRSGEAVQTARVTVEPNPGLAFALEPDGATVRTGDVVRFRIDARSEGGGGGPEVSPAWTVAGVGAEIDTDGPEGVFVAEEPGRYLVYAVIGEEVVRSTNVDVTERQAESELVEVGRGAISTHHSGDMWAFEGLDGRDYVYVGTYMHDLDEALGRHRRRESSTDRLPAARRPSDQRREDPREQPSRHRHA